MINTTTPTGMLAVRAIFVLVVLGGIGVIELAAESAVAMTSVVVTERGEVMKTAVVERALEAEAMAERNEDIKDKTDAEDSEVMNAAEAEVVEVTVFEVTVVEATVAEAMVVEVTVVEVTVVEAMRSRISSGP